MSTTHHTTPVLIVGGGPAGLLLALQLSRCGTRSLLIERNPTTTTYPKMDLTNARSMELFRPNRLNIGSAIREIGVPPQYSLGVLFSTGLAEGGEVVSKWDLASVAEKGKSIQEKNDGSQPREAYQRGSQALFEKYLQSVIQKDPLIESHWGWKFESLVEHDDHVNATVTEAASGKQHTVEAQYLVGCDGGGSRVRKSIDGKMLGGPVPGALYLVHFKSKDLTRLHKQGQFWHIFFTSGHAIISQDEVDTWTLHTLIAVDTDTSNWDPKQVVYRGLAGSVGGGEGYPGGGRFEIDIDEVLVTSVWRPNIYVADKYSGGKGRVFLSGDAAHQIVPTGGYGMNTAVGDSFDLGWKLAAVLEGWGGEELLRNYEIERMPVADRCQERSGVHWSFQAEVWAKAAESKGAIVEQNEEGRLLKSGIDRRLQENDSENKDQGTELGYRYNASTVVVKDEEVDEPEQSFREYIPSTWPGVRAPHLFLKDRKRSIFDLFGSGKEYSLVDFSSDGRWIEAVAALTKEMGLPLRRVHLPEETHARQIWERDAVLVRPDDHVCWRAPVNGKVEGTNLKQVLKTVTGNVQLAPSTIKATANASGKREAFTGTIGNVDRDEVDRLASFQNE